MCEPLQSTIGSKTIKLKSLSIDFQAINHSSLSVDLVKQFFGPTVAMLLQISANYIIHIILLCFIAIECEMQSGQTSALSYYTW